MLTLQLRNALILSALTLTCVAAVVFHQRPAHSNPSTPPSSSNSSCGVTTEITRALLIPKDARTRGNPKAPTTIVAFMDFQCRACADASPTVNDIVARSKGRVNLVVHHVQIKPEHTLTPILTRIAEAAGAQGLYWPTYDMIFKGHREITAAKSDGEAYRVVRNSAALLRLNLQRLDTDVTKKEFDKALAAGEKLVEDIRVMGTPSFFVVSANGRISRYNGVATLQNWANGKAESE